jgi:hypothetical protein
LNAFCGTNPPKWIELSGNSIDNARDLAGLRLFAEAVIPEL